MVLVDVNSVKPEPKSSSSSSETEGTPLVKAINSLVTSNEFSKNDYGSDAKAIAFLAKDLEEILEQPDLDPAEKLKMYNQKLKTYLFLVRENDNNNSLKKSPSVNVSEQNTDDDDDNGYEDAGDRLESNISTVSKRRTPSTSSLFVETPQASKTPSHFPERKQHKNNLPRATPIVNRLRGAAARQKNSRLKGFLVNWQQYGEEE